MEEFKVPESKAITIYDIAKESDVSPATVSRVLTNNARVSAEKKEKVQAVINKYNFKPNALARGLVDTKRKVIGIIVADIRNPFYSELFVACEQAAQERGYTVILCNSFGEQEKEEFQLEKLEEQRVDAIILAGGRVDDLNSNEEFVELVNNVTNTIPVIITGKLDGTNCYQVHIDAIKSMDLVLEYLFSLNHQEIAIVGGRKNVLSTFDKIQRYKQLLSKHQIKFRPEFVDNFGHYDSENGYKRMAELLDNEIIPTAVIAINDFTASGAINCIYDKGYRIPEDISVVSYDNTFISDVMTPKLTGIDYNYAEYGEKLIETCIAAIEKAAVPRIQFIEPRLIVKDSCVKRNV